MKRFKIISRLFVIVITVIFCCNTYYLVRLYGSIRDTVERNVMTAIADADLDELWVRADRAKAGSREAFEAREEPEDTLRKGEVSVYQDTSGDMVTTTRHADGTVKSEGFVVSGNGSFTNKFIDVVGKQFHGIMDPYVPVDLEVMDSVVTKRLNDRYMYPSFVVVEIVDSTGRAVVRNKQPISGQRDIFTYFYNPDEGLAYRLSMTPLTRHILSQMAGIIVTTFLLILTFALAFWFLLHTVSRQRTLEEMKDDFINNMTHELKTPIAIAYSANDALLNYDADGHPVKRVAYLKIANRQLIRLGELVENILAMSMERRKTMQLQMEEIALDIFLEEVATTNRMRTGKELEIRTAIEAGISVIADKSHLANVVNNLIDNAFKYSGEKVEITISANAEGISVADNGYGIPSKSLPYIFNRFYRVPHGNRQDVRGYGIGLYYVKSVLDKMGWSITVESKVGEGSVFKIKFGKDGK